MEFLVASSIGLLTMCGTYLLLRGRTFPVVVGLAMLSYAVNVFLFAMGRLTINMPPILISFGMTALIVVLSIRTFLEIGNDHVDGRPAGAPSEAGDKN